MRSMVLSERTCPAQMSTVFLTQLIILLKLSLRCEEGNPLKIPIGYNPLTPETTLECPSVEFPFYRCFK